MDDRLDFTRSLPDFTRLIWNSPEAQELWAPRVSLASRAFQEIERLSVVEGVRPSALVSVQDWELSAAAAWAAERGLAFVPLQTTAASRSYATTMEAPQAGQPVSFRCAITRPDLAKEWVRAWKERDDRAIGVLLGYPECCQDFFQRVWVEEGMVDTTWPMAAGGASVSSVVVAGPWQANILLRWLGVRMVSHLPCSPTCEKTIERANDFAAVGREHGMEWEVDLIEEMLSWPVQWSALHGIAEIKTPVVKIAARTDATAGRYEVNRKGTRYPEEGAKGNSFPYQERGTVGVTKGKSFQNLVQLLDARDWTYNGFASREAMDRSHAALAKASRGDHRTILDLGCGTGELLMKVRREQDGWPKVRMVGVESSAERVAHGRRVNEEVEFVVADFMRDLNSWQGAYDLIIFMPGRLVEVDAAEAARVVSLLMSRGKNLLFYAYGDWLERPGGLEGLLRDHHIPVPEAMIETSEAHAGVVEGELSKIGAGSGHGMAF